MDAISKLPAELFSQIFSDASLSWYDLQRARLVCKDWNQKIIGGKDPKMRKALFLLTATVIDSNADVWPTEIHFQVDVSAQLLPEPGKLPVTVYDLAYKFLFVDGGHVFRGYVLVHPGLKVQQQLLPHAHPAFAIQDPANPPTAYTGDLATFRFTSLDDLDTLTIPSQQTAGWENELALSPGVTNSTVVIRWTKLRRPITGVSAPNISFYVCAVPLTMGHVIDAIRTHLRNHAVHQIRTCAHLLKPERSLHWDQGRRKAVCTGNGHGEDRFLSTDQAHMMRPLQMQMMDWIETDTYKGFDTVCSKVPRMSQEMTKCAGLG